MLKISIIIIISILRIGILTCQNNDSTKCIVTKVAVGNGTEIYFNQEDKELKFNFLNHKIIDTYKLKEEPHFSSDSITSKSPVSKFITKNDERIQPLKFDTIEFKHNNLDNIKILYSLNVNFIGSELIDRIEIRKSDYKQNGKSPFEIHFYENKNSTLIKLENCTSYIWSNPMKILVSDLKFSEMNVVILLTEGDNPEIYKELIIHSKEKE